MKKNRQIQYKQIYKCKYNANKFTMKKNRQIQYKQIYKCKKIGKYNTNKFTNEKK